MRIPYGYILEDGQFVLDEVEGIRCANDFHLLSCRGKPW